MGFYSRGLMICAPLLTQIIEDVVEYGRRSISIEIKKTVVVSRFNGNNQLFVRERP